MKTLEDIKAAVAGKTTLSGGDAVNLINEIERVIATERTESDRRAAAQIARYDSIYVSGEKAFDSDAPVDRREEDIRDEIGIVRAPNPPRD